MQLLGRPTYPNHWLCTPIVGGALPLSESRAAGATLCTGNAAGDIPKGTLSWFGILPANGFRCFATLAVVAAATSTDKQIFVSDKADGMRAYRSGHHDRFRIPTSFFSVQDRR